MAASRSWRLRSMMPLPSHLRNCVLPSEANVDEEPLQGIVKCSCGSECFQLLHPGEIVVRGDRRSPGHLHASRHSFFIITAKCDRCETEHLLFDKVLHGWNGFVCRDPVASKLPRPPLQPWKCLNCESIVHKATVHIGSEGKAGFVEVARGIFEGTEWPNA